MSESKQRWRIVFARDDDARFLSHLDAVHLWERAFRRGEIPVATSGGFSPRPRLVFAAPLPLGMLAEHELADLFLSERLTRLDLRVRLSEGMPRGYRLIDLHDEWIGGPAVATQLVAADYRMTLLGVEREDLASAATRILSAERLPRERRRETKTVAYDLRPLIIELRVRDADAGTLAADGAPAEAAELWMRLRHSQERGSGRADEVVAALADELGMTTASETPGATETPSATETPGVDRPRIESAVSVRERLWLEEELTQHGERDQAPSSPEQTAG